MKNYSDEVINEIQNAISNEESCIRILTHVDELPKEVYSNDVKIKLLTVNNVNDVVLYPQIIFDQSEFIEWRKEPVKRFFINDWKSINKGIDIFENNQYIELSFNVKDVNVIVLLRRIIELSGEENDVIEQYGDIYYNGSKYTIIKAYSPSINETYNSPSVLENIKYTEKLMDYYGQIIRDNTKCENGDGDDIEIISYDDPNNNINDMLDGESEELF